MAETTLANWLIEQLRYKNWSQNDLARKAKLTSGSISNYINGRRPDTDACRSIARALNVSEEMVLRLAGHLPKEKDYDPERDEWNALYEQMSEEDRKDFLDFARVKAKKSNKKRN